MTSDTKKENNSLLLLSSFIRVHPRFNVLRTVTVTKTAYILAISYSFQIFCADLWSYGGVGSGGKNDVGARIWRGKNMNARRPSRQTASFDTRARLDVLLGTEETVNTSNCKREILQ